MKIQCALGWLVVGCSSSPLPITAVDGQPVTVPAEWVSVDSNCGFTFHSPPSFARKAIEPLDSESCMGVFEGESIRFGYKYSRFAKSLVECKDMPQFTETPVSVDGASGAIITCEQGARRLVGLYIDNDGRGKKLQASAMCSTDACENKVRAVFSTITWKR